MQSSPSERHLRSQRLRRPHALSESEGCPTPSQSLASLRSSHLPTPNPLRPLDPCRTHQPFSHLTPHTPTHNPQPTPLARRSLLHSSPPLDVRRHSPVALPPSAPSTNRSHNEGRMSADKEYTYSDVSEHNTKKDCFVVVHDKVYNASSFVDEHPYVSNSHSP